MGYNGRRRGRATISAVTVTGTVNTALPGDATAEITLTGDTLVGGVTFTLTGTAVDWFNGAPAGVRVDALGMSGGSGILLVFYGNADNRLNRRF